MSALDEFINLTLAERDSFAAVLEILRQADRDYKDNNISRYDFANKVMSVINSAPQQCLAEIKAEAGRAGFVAGFGESDSWVNGEVGASDSSVLKMAEEYADKVRQGGE